MPPYQNPNSTDTVDSSAERSSSSSTNRAVRVILVTSLALLLVVLSVIGIFSFTLTSPHHKSELTFTIEPGSSVKEIANNLKAVDLIRSEISFYVAALLWYDTTALKAGNYRIEAGTDVRSLLAKFTAGDFILDLVRITHVEGERVSTFAIKVEPLLKNFDAAEFIDLAIPYEGRIFPDTYLVPPDFTAEQLFDLTRETFTKKTAELQPGLDDHPFLSAEEVIILASILEREANSPESKKMVSGILQNRLEIGMALQADATIEYVLDKPLSDLTPEDLERDTPYNTYLYPGLPPSPIGNPGLTALNAVLNPTPSDYFFYITGNDGRFYYAKDFDQHRVNIARYLR